MMKLQSTRSRGRCQNLDLLRVILLFGVLFLHTNGINYFRVIMASIGECSVTGFIMLSGYFLMNSDKDYSYKEWLKKTCKKLIVPWVTALFLYLFEETFFTFMYTGKVDVILQLKFLINMGYPVRGWHLWFMCPFTQIYLFFPVLKKWKRNNKFTYYASVVIWASLAWLIDFSDVHWGLTVISFIWAFIAGDMIGTFLGCVRKIYAYSMFFLLLVLKSFIAISAVNDLESISFINSRLVNWIFILTMLIFFVNVKISINLYTFTKYFLWIYILHVFVGDFLSAVKIRIGTNEVDIWWLSLIDVGIIFVICFIICIIAERTIGNIRRVKKNE